MTQEIALASARDVAAYLKKAHGATRVLLFGSATVASFLPQHSDIDIYFEGLPYEKECLVAGETFLQFVDLDLDLMPDGHAPPYLKNEILKTGVAL